jgi:hypothetical protein
VGLKVVAGVLALVGLQIADIEGLSNTLASKAQIYPLHAQEDANNVVNYSFPVGHAARYGIVPGPTNWENAAPAKVVQWYSICTQPDVIGVLGPGYYGSSFNIIGVEYSNFKAVFDGAVIGGILHVQSHTEVTVSSPKLTGVSIGGTYTVLDRLGLTNCFDCAFGDVTCDSNPALNVGSGTKGRGVHIHAGNDTLYFKRLRITDAVNTNNTDAACAIDGNGNNPKNITIDELVVDDSDCHGLYLTGTGHHIKRCIIKGFSRLQNVRGMEDSNGLAQSQRGCGIWINRATGVIDYCYISQKGSAGARPFAVHELLVDETDISNNGVFRIRNLIVYNLGLGGSTGTVATSTGRGICVGDKDHLTGSGQINLIIENMEVRQAATTTTLAPTFYGVNFFARAAGTSATVTGDITLLDFGATNGLFVDTNVRYTQIATARYTSAVSARGTAFHYKGRCTIEGKVWGQWAGSSLAANDGVIWDAQPGSTMGAVHLDGLTSGATTKVGLRLKGSYTTVGPVYSTAVRSDVGTVVFDATTNVTLRISQMQADGSAPVSNVGLYFVGANVNPKIYDGAILNFGKSFMKHAAATLAGLVFVNVNAVKKVDAEATDGNLIAANYTAVGVCSGLPV